MDGNTLEGDETERVAKTFESLKKQRAQQPYRKGLVKTWFRSLVSGKETIEQSGENYLQSIGLRWEDLEGKTILQIGSDNAAFVTAARMKHINIIPINRYIEDRPEDET